MKKISNINILIVFASSFLLFNCNTVEDDVPNASQGEAFALPLNDRQGNSRDRLNDDNEAGGVASRVGNKTPLTLRDLSILADGRTWEFPEGSVDVLGSDVDDVAFTKDVSIRWKRPGFHSVVVKPNFTFPTDRVADTLYFRVLEEFKENSRTRVINRADLRFANLNDNETFAGTTLTYVIDADGLPTRFDGPADAANPLPVRRTIGDQMFNAIEYTTPNRPDADEQPFTSSVRSFVPQGESEPLQKIALVSFDFRYPGTFNFSAALRAAGHPDSLVVAFNNIKVLEPNFVGSLGAASKIENTVTVPFNRNIDLDALDDAALESLKTSFKLQKTGIVSGMPPSFVEIPITKVVKIEGAKDRLAFLVDDLKEPLAFNEYLAVSYDGNNSLKDIFGNLIGNTSNPNNVILDNTNILANTALDFGNTEIYSTGDPGLFNFFSEAQSLGEEDELIVTDDRSILPTRNDGEILPDPLTLRLVRKGAGDTALSVWARGGVSTGSTQLKSGAKYFISFWAKVDQPNVNIQFFGPNGFEQVFNLDSAGNTWQYHRREIVIGARSSNAINMRFRRNNNATSDYELLINKLRVFEVEE